MGRAAQSLGVRAEARAVAALEGDGWAVLGRRVRTPAGEIDLVVSRDGMLVFVEVKSRPVLAEAAAALTVRQRGRLVAAAGIWMGSHPEWGAAGVRFDVVLVDAAGRVRRIADAFREGE